MKGTSIILTSPPRGTFLEGTIADTSYPGTIMQVKAGAAFIGGRPQWIAGAPGVDGIRMLPAVLLEDDNQGGLYSTAYSLNTRCRLYCPIPGEEMNVMCGEVAGTANWFTIGERLYMDAESGLLVPETGTSAYFATSWVVMEKTSGLAGSSLVWAMYIG